MPGNLGSDIHLLHTHRCHVDLLFTCSRSCHKSLPQGVWSMVSRQAALRPSALRSPAVPACHPHPHTSHCADPHSPAAHSPAQPLPPRPVSFPPPTPPPTALPG